MRLDSLANKYRKSIEQRRFKGRRDMTLEHQLELIDRYPRLYRLARRHCRPPAHSLFLYGFCCGDGWFDIINRLSSWRRLKSISEIGDVLRMSPDKIATFVRKTVPSLERSLR